MKRRQNTAAVAVGLQFIKRVNESRFTDLNGLLFCGPFFEREHEVGQFFCDLNGLESVQNAVYAVGARFSSGHFSDGYDAEYIVRRDLDHGTLVLAIPKCCSGVPERHPAFYLHGAVGAVEIERMALALLQVRT